MNDKFETLQMLNNYMKILIMEIEKAVECFKGGEDRKGCNLIPPITDGIEWMSEALVSTKDTHKLDINLKDMNEKLSEIVEALENGDFILIGDLFQYELIPILENIQKLINKVLTS